MNLFEVTAVLRSEIMFQGGLGNHLIQPSGSYASCPITYITQADSADAALSKVCGTSRKTPISVIPLSNAYFLP